jgi:hypothetical protein
MARLRQEITHAIYGHGSATRLDVTAGQVAGNGTGS